VKRSAAPVVDVANAVVAVTSTVPAAWAGEFAVQLVVEVQLTPVAGVPSNLTVVAPTSNPLPVRVTVVPPVVEPDAGLMPEMAGPSVTVRDVVADGPPLLDTLRPVKTFVVEVPAESVTVSVAVNAPKAV
jgi:hypothetical protein